MWVKVCHDFLHVNQETNNVVEALAIWKGLLQARNQGILDLTVIGDSRLIIQELVTISLPSQLILRQLLRRIQNITISFQKMVVNNTGLPP